MTENEKPHDGYGYARPGSRMEEVMRRRGSYVPQSLIQDFKDSLRLICIDGGSQEGELQDVEIKPSRPYKDFAYSLEIQHRGYNKDTLAPLLSLTSELEAYVSGRTDVMVNEGGQFTRISGNNFSDIMHVLNEGFIKPHDPEANIDVDSRMAASQSNGSWVNRSEGNDTPGSGVGSR